MKCPRDGGSCPSLPDCERVCWRAKPGDKTGWGVIPEAEMAGDNTMKEFKVYLAGPISGLTFDEGQDWRTYVRGVLAQSGIKGYSPLRQKHFLREAGVLSGSYPNPMATSRGIMTRDHFDVKTADLIFVNFLGAKKLSAGTVMELGWAYAYGKPVVCAIEPDDTVHAHPMIEEAIGYRLPTLDAAIAVTQAILLPHTEGEV